MTEGLPQIAKDAQRARAAIEAMFSRMRHRYKYPTGLDLRAAAKAVVVAAMRTWREHDHKRARADELVEAVDMLLLELQLGKEINAFGSWPEFDAVSKLVEDMSQQSERWRNSLRKFGQNAPAHTSPEQRASTLSSRSASTGAVP